MADSGFIQIQTTGSKGNRDLSPENYDIRELMGILGIAEDLIGALPSGRNRPIISYRVEEGSVKHILTTSLQFVIGFNAVIGQVGELHNLDFLEPKTAAAIEFLQKTAREQDYAFTISTSLESSNELRVDSTTQFSRISDVWVDAEFYLYGKITNAGGKEKANVHLHTAEFGSLTIKIPQKFLADHDKNLLYKDFGVRVKGQQNLRTGEMNQSSLEFVELIDYAPMYDPQYLGKLRAKARDTWQHVDDPAAWLRGVRGEYDA